MCEKTQDVEVINIKDKVKLKLTGQEGMVVGKIINSEEVYIVRLMDHSEITFRKFEIEKVKNE